MTHGRILFRGNRWQVTARPDVMLILRRLFAVEAAKGPLQLAATEEASSMLMWVMERWPMQMGPLERRELFTRGRAFDTRREAVGEILVGHIPQRDYGLALQLRDYQKQAVEMALRVPGLILGDDLGLGKTITALGSLSAGRAFPALVVTLPHLVRQWEREVHRALPQATVHIGRRMQPPLGPDGKVAIPASQCSRGDGAPPVVRGLPDVVILNYHKIRDWGHPCRGAFAGAVFDEGQELRTGDAALKYPAAVKAASAAKVRLILSATPVYGYGAEAYNLLEVIAPGALGTREEFERTWATGEKGLIPQADAFGAHLREMGLFLRRTRRDVGRELPPLTRIIQEIPCDAAPLADRADVAAALAEIILGRASQAAQRGQASMQLDALIRQATGVGKAPYVAEWVNTLLEEQEGPVILVGWHRAVYEIWQRRLAHHNPVMLTGSESPTAKARNVDLFTRGESRVLILSVRSGIGIEGLQRVCDTVVFGELDWSPGIHEQVEGRVNREGQVGPAMSYYLTSEEGSDPLMMEVLGVKSGQSHQIRDPDAPMSVAQQIDPDRLRELAKRFQRAAHPVHKGVAHRAHRV